MTREEIQKKFNSRMSHLGGLMDGEFKGEWRYSCDLDKFDVFIDIMDALCDVVPDGYDLTYGVNRLKVNYNSGVYMIQPVFGVYLNDVMVCRIGYDVTDGCYYDTENVVDYRYNEVDNAMEHISSRIANYILIMRH